MGRVRTLPAALLTFEPREIGSIACWFDPSDRGQLVFAASDTLVGEYKNKGTLLVPSAFQGTAANQPTWSATSFNRRPGLSFDSGDFMDIADHAGFDCTVFEIFASALRTTDAGGTQGFFGKGGGFGVTTEQALIISGGDQMQLQVSADGIAASATVKTENNGSTNNALNTPYIYHGYYDGANVGLSVNGGSYVTDALGGLYNGTAVCQVGRTYGASFQGVLGDILFFTKTLTTNQRRWILEHLSRRTGVELIR